MDIKDCKVGMEVESKVNAAETGTILFVSEQRIVFKRSDNSEWFKRPCHYNEVKPPKKKLYLWRYRFGDNWFIANGYHNTKEEVARIHYLNNVDPIKRIDNSVIEED